MADVVVATAPTTDNHVVLHKWKIIWAGVPLRAKIGAEVLPTGGRPIVCIVLATERLTNKMKFFWKDISGRGLPTGGRPIARIVLATKRLTKR